MRSRAGAGGARGPLGMGPRGPWSPSGSSSNSTGVGCGSSLQRERRREIVKRERTGYENINIHNSKADKQSGSKEEEQNTEPDNRKEQRCRYTERSK